MVPPLRRGTWIPAFAGMTGEGQERDAHSEALAAPGAILGELVQPDATPASLP